MLHANFKGRGDDAISCVPILSWTFNVYGSPKYESNEFTSERASGWKRAVFECLMTCWELTTLRRGGKIIHTHMCLTWTKNAQLSPYMGNILAACLIKVNNSTKHANISNTHESLWQLPNNWELVKTQAHLKTTLLSTFQLDSRIFHRQYW